ncbi:MAG: flagellar hook-length control protein FliK [Devosia sp.]
MSSNLTISYTSQTAAGTTPTGGPAADAPAADSPLGFLAALVDQLLSGGAQATSTTASTETGAGLSLPGLVDLAISSKTQTGTAPEPATPDLVADLSAQLDALKSQLADGAAPTPDQLRSLNASIEALTKAVDAPTTTIVSSTAAAQSPVGAPAITKADPLPTEQILQLLTSLGLIQPQEPTTDTASASTEMPAPAVPSTDAITALQDKLHALSQQLAATSPALAQNLEALAAKLDGAAANPQIAAQITAPAPSQDALTIAKIVRALLGGAPAQPVTPADDKPHTAPVNPQPSADAQDQLFQILTNLGVSAAPAPGTTPTAASDETPAVQPVTSAVPPTLVRLSAQLSQLSTELAASSPDLAKKLDAVATKLVSIDANTSLQAQITGAATDPDSAALDKLVQSLIDNKPIATPARTTPQIATTTDLKVPAAIIAPTSKSAKLDIDATSAPIATDDTAPRPIIKVTAATPADTVVADAAPKPEAKLVRDIADAVKADVATSTPTPVPTTAPAIQAPIARVLPAAYQPVANPINMGQVAFEMVHQISQGASRFTIRLDPPELGRVDVKMHVAETGAVNARLIVDRAETLDLFQRDQRSLERALAQAGLDSSKTSLEFSLRQNPFAGMTGGDQRPQSNPYASARFSSDETEEALPTVTLYRGTASAGGVNLFV